MSKPSQPYYNGIDLTQQSFADLSAWYNVLRAVAAHEQAHKIVVELQRRDEEK